MIRYTQMHSAHTARIAELEKLCFTDPWSEKSVASELSNPLSRWIVALDGDTVVGYIGSQTVIDQADIMNVAVDPQYRRQGIGERLLHMLTDQLAENGVVAVLLEVRASNTSAIRLYEKQGFVPVGRRKNYYLTPREDALIMKKELAS